MGNKEQCTVWYRAGLAVNINEAKKQFADSRKHGIIALSCGVGLLVFWGALLTFRYRVLKRRVTKLIAEILCMLLTIAAFVALALALDQTSPDKRLPFTVAVNKEIRKAPSEAAQQVYFLARKWTEKDCEKTLQLTPQQRNVIQRKMSALGVTFEKNPLYYASLIFCTCTVLFFFTSAISAIVVVIGKRQHTAPFRNPRVIPSTRRSIPEKETAEFFSRFIEQVPQPPDNIVLSATSQCTICGEAMLEDVGFLHACKHLFHRKCILHWLMYADKPKCPECDEPIRLRTTNTTQVENELQDNSSDIDEGVS